MYMAYHKDHYQGIDLTNVTVRTDILVAIIRPPTTANPVQRACPRTPGIRIGLLTLISLEYCKEMENLADFSYEINDLVVQNAALWVTINFFFV